MIFGDKILAEASCNIKKCWLQSGMLAVKMVELWVLTSLVYASYKWLKQSRGQGP